GPGCQRRRRRFCPAIAANPGRWRRWKKGKSGPASRPASGVVRPLGSLAGLRPDLLPTLLVLVVLGSHLGDLSGHFHFGQRPATSLLLFSVDAIQYLQHRWTGPWYCGLYGHGDPTWRQGSAIARECPESLVFQGRSWLDPRNRQTHLIDFTSRKQLVRHS